MTEHEWISSNSPARMFQHVALKKVPMSVRKKRLWVGACFSLSTHNYPPTRDIVAYKNGLPFDGEGAADLDSLIESWCMNFYDSKGDPTMAQRADLLRDILGNPFRAGAEWRYGHLWIDAEAPPGKTCLRNAGAMLTPLVLGLAKEAYSKRLKNGSLDTARLAVLADALEEAGLETPRQPADVSVRGWSGSHDWQVIVYPIGGYYRGDKGEVVHAAGRKMDAVKWAEANLSAKNWRRNNHFTWNNGMPPSFTLGSGLTRHLPHPLVSHLHEPGPHFRGCHAVDLILGKS